MRWPIRFLTRSVLISLGLLFLALFLAWRIARGIVRPLEAMVATASRIAAGDVDARMSVHQGTPEIVALERAFDRMVQARDLVERALRENERKLAITLQSIGDAVIATDVEGRIARMNPAAERLTGWPLHEALAMPLTEVFPNQQCANWWSGHQSGSNRAGNRRGGRHGQWGRVAVA